MMLSRRRAPIGLHSAHRTVILTVLATLVSYGTGHADTAGLSAEDVARLRTVFEVAISPSGAHTAYTLVVQRQPGKDDDGPAWTELHVVGADGRSRGYVTGEVRAARISWTPDSSAILFLGRRGEDAEESLYRIPVDGGEAQVILEHGDGILEYAWSPTGDRVAFLAKPEVAEDRKKVEEKGFRQEVFEEDWRPVELWIAALQDGAVGEPLKMEIPGSASEIAFSPDGSRLSVALAPTSLVDDGYMKRRLHILDAVGGEILGSVDTSGKLGRVAWSPDGSRLAMIAGADAHDPAAARLMVVPSSGGAAEILAADRAVDAVDVAWLDAETLLWICAEGVDARVEKMVLGGTSVPIFSDAGPIWRRMSIAPESGAIALSADAPTHPNEIYMGNANGKAPVRVTDSNPWLSERRLAAQEVVAYVARDGLALQGLLMQPVDRGAGEEVPLVLIVHGGPEAHFSNGWLTTYSRPGQVLAGRGYAVFYPNYRGSTGRGLEFALTSQADPAGREFDDLIDAVDHLVAEGLVDPERVGITGGSYGGYATAWGATYFSERFAAGVMAVGISEMIAKLGTSDIPYELYQVHARIWPWENWQKMLERSPVYYVEKARTPLLILGGDADPRVHPSQSLALYRYLKILGQAPVRYVVYPDEKHGNAKAAARYDFSLRLLRWFDHYLDGPGGEPPPHSLDYGLEPEEEDQGSP